MNNNDRYLKFTKLGFTLIELLAVILILGIIALIAIPTVNKILYETKIGAFESTLNNIEKKVSDNCNKEILKGDRITSRYDLSDGIISPNIDIKGNLPFGTIKVDNKCNVTFELSNNNYVGIKNNINNKVVINKCNTGKCIKYKENILNGAIPDIDDGMIPVIIENNGTVKKANLYTKWYEYGNNKKNWANVVIFKDLEKRNLYKNAADGSIINKNDISAYLVWIPRFSYLIPEGEGPREITINFENKEMEKNYGDAVTSFYTHPAFTFGDEELNGIWVGKFETTGTTTEPTCLPNSQPLFQYSVSQYYETAKIFNNYGIKTDAHMMKDSEWGAAAYLSHSKYGINQQIRLNSFYYFYGNYEGGYGYKTGSGAKEEDSSTNASMFYGSTQINNYVQSTTGNISGVFDMSGGVHEYVMGNYNHYLGDSGFSSLPSDSKYYDLYTTSDYTTACNGKLCKGFANYETKNWYNDSYITLSKSYPWVRRGGAYNSTSNAGAFATFDGNGSSKYNNNAFRLTISPINR